MWSAFFPTNHNWFMLVMSPTSTKGSRVLFPYPHLSKFETRYFAVRFEDGKVVDVNLEHVAAFSQEDAADFEARFNQKIEQVNAEIKKPYQLSASIGTYLTQPDAEMKLFTLISQADQIMYERKKLKHSSRYLG